MYYHFCCDINFLYSNFAAISVRHGEKLMMNQYWYSAKTIETMVAEIEDVGKRVAFLSTPSLYFSLKNEKVKRESRLFDFDDQWASDPNFVKFNFKEVDKIPAQYHHYFDYVVVDPPFITDVVWEQYAVAVKLLLVHEAEKPSASLASSVVEGPNQSASDSLEENKQACDEATNPFATSKKTSNSPIRTTRSLSSSSSDSTSGSLPGRSTPFVSSSTIPEPCGMPAGKVLLSTIPEHEQLLYSLLGASARRFRPSIPSLIYQYVLYTNYNPNATKRLGQLNPEIDPEGDEANEAQH